MCSATYTGNKSPRQRRRRKMPGKPAVNGRLFSFGNSDAGGAGTYQSGAYSFSSSEVPGHVGSIMIEASLVLILPACGVLVVVLLF